MSDKPVPTLQDYLDRCAAGKPVPSPTADAGTPQEAIERFCTKDCEWIGVPCADRACSLYAFRPQSARKPKLDPCNDADHDKIEETWDGMRGADD